MNDEIIADLKQFITATVSQATAHLAAKDDLINLKDEIDSRITGLRTEMNNRFDGLDTKLETVADAHAESLQDHEQRITALEHANPQPA